MKDNLLRGFFQVPSPSQPKFDYIRKELHKKSQERDILPSEPSRDLPTRPLARATELLQFYFRHHGPHDVEVKFAEKRI